MFKSANLFHYIYYIVLILLAVPDCISLLYEGLFNYAIYLFSFYCVLVLILCFIGRLFSSVIRLTYYGILLGFSFLCFLIDIFCILKMQMRFNESFAGIIVGTNLSEAIKFIQSYLDWTVISLIFSCILFCLTIYYLLRLVPDFLKKSVSYLFAFICVVGVTTIVRMPSIINDSVIGKMRMLYDLPSPPDLRNYYTSPKIKKNNLQPENIVIIIGESFSKSHSSLYGYHMQTNPLLETYATDSSLVVYTNVTSDVTTTVESFQRIMSTYSGTGTWYEYTTLPELISLCGYKSTWISNQSKTGLADNVVSRYAELCDDVYFVGDRFGAGMRKSLDEEVLQPLSSRVKSNDGKNVYFIHLMGSHESFNKRYPSDFSYFVEDMYSNLPTSQRKIVSEYDNSIRYNDKVVSDIFSLFSEKENIVFYFSDHALDVFESTDSYCGHSIIGDSASVYYGKQIPYMVYTSEKFRNNFPNLYTMIKNSSMNNISTNNFVYTLLKVMGCSLSIEK